jgi:hypothetical protein
MEPRTSSRTGTSRTHNARAGQQPDTTETTDETSAPLRREQPSELQTRQPIGIVNKMKESATTQLTTQKDRATEGIGTLAQAVRQTTERLRDDRHETVAAYVERAAEQLERLSSNLRGKDVNELLQDAQRLARRRPALFIGGSFAVGLLAARFLKSSPSSETRNHAWTESPGTDTHTSDLPGAY